MDDGETKAAHIKYMEVSPPLREVDQTLIWVLVRWYFAHERDFPATSELPIKDDLRVRTWHKVEPLESLMGMGT